jgi:hypothetical protein
MSGIEVLAIAVIAAVGVIWFMGRGKKPATTVQDFVLVKPVQAAEEIKEAVAKVEEVASHVEAAAVAVAAQTEVLADKIEQTVTEQVTKVKRTRTSKTKVQDTETGDVPAKPRRTRKQKDN